jgi:tryptophanyl-tRNA synthetase
MKDIILTGDRPTGKLHIGHYVGSIMNRIKLQNEGNYDKMYVFIADSQALTDNFDNPDKVRSNVLEVTLDYLACGIDPEKVTIFIQSMIPELTELTFYYMNLVTVARLLRNPTVKSEISMRGFDNTVPSGFLNYPISQTADITAFKANCIPVGDDQLPMLEQCNEIVRKFNSIYGDVLVECEAYLPQKEAERRVPGIDGKSKMSKSLGNAIYLADTKEEVARKVMLMYTDPDHIKVSDPGKVEGNIVFLYLDIFANDEHFKKYLPEYQNLDELKNKYRAGGLGDVVIKKFLINVLEEELEPIRERRHYYENHLDEVYDIIKKGTQQAIEDANKTLIDVKKAIGIDYFSNQQFYLEINDKYKQG